MAKVKVAAFVAGAAKSGITIALSEGRGGQCFRIGMTEAAQREFFGGPLDPSKDAIEILLDDEPGSVHFMGLSLAALDDAAALPIAGGIKGSISLKVVPWCKVAAGKRPAASLPVLNRKGCQLVTVRLPDWARLEPRKIGQGRSIMG